MSTTPDYGEPWKMTPIDDHDSLFQLALIRTRNGVEVCDPYREGTIRECDERGERIVACINACQGMADPAAEIEAMREAIREAYLQLTYASKSNAASVIHIHVHNAADRLHPFIKP